MGNISPALSCRMIVSYGIKYYSQKSNFYLTTRGDSCGSGDPFNSAFSVLINLGNIGLAFILLRLRLQFVQQFSCPVRCSFSRFLIVIQCMEEVPVLSSFMPV